MITHLALPYTRSLVRTHNRINRYLCSGDTPLIYFQPNKSRLLFNKNAIFYNIYHSDGNFHSNTLELRPPYLCRIESLQHLQYDILSFEAF